jgi:hypothetical protein
MENVPRNSERSQVGAVISEVIQNERVVVDAQQRDITQCGRCMTDDIVIWVWDY